MGSVEGYSEADRAIAQASKSGHWVLLRNVHLCPEWLSKLEKRLQLIASHSHAHDNFRLFLTCEISPALPAGLLRMSDVLFIEASTGVKASMMRFYSSIAPERAERAPSERNRLYSLLAWLNAVVQERLRYVPLGWTKRYEFSEADFFCALVISFVSITYTHIHISIYLSI
jgi:dynein heavy chain 1